MVSLEIFGSKAVGLVVVVLEVAWRAVPFYVMSFCGCAWRARLFSGVLCRSWATMPMLGIQWLSVCL